jgi:hypothetical protein
MSHAVENTASHLCEEPEKYLQLRFDTATTHRTRCEAFASNMSLYSVHTPMTRQLADFAVENGGI